MYDEGCPWREDPEDCTTQGMPGRADVSQHGLQYLLVSFYDAVELVLARYSPPGHVFSMEFRTHAEVVAASDFVRVETRAERVALLQSDPEVKFVVASFAGDAFNGLGAILGLLHDETSELLAQAHTELQTLFVVYLCFTAVGFYLLLFRSTVALASGEVHKTRELVTMMPLHTLKPEEVHRVIDRFAPPTSSADDDRDHPVGDMPHDSQGQPGDPAAGNAAFSSPDCGAEANTAAHKFVPTSRRGKAGRRAAPLR
eukprot:CAMPEP_0196760700 /NCGR_PEP_ID=MMETSP1091-20130531/105366_1 /TAXON_ID=302021 /ORGANISM="Rhodomonas sp., Strain CCMP768" /LENGTH=255 /DNA_ID=CAMNT_0042109617 /DNA_START=38 /DNA_END=802 /DNA_ORIENTATION=+